ncbi:hypothetical protein AC249_AIPGENE678, partial [Exaiptasia diaphana]
DISRQSSLDEDDYKTAEDDDGDDDEEDEENIYTSKKEEPSLQRVFEPEGTASTPESIELDHIGRQDKEAGDLGTSRGFDDNCEYLDTKL